MLYIDVYKQIIVGVHSAKGRVIEIVRKTKSRSSTSG